MLRRSATFLAGVVALGGLSVATAEVAAAHTGEVTKNCKQLNVNLTNYNAEKTSGGAFKNSVKTTIDGSVVTDTKFGSAFSKTYAWTEYESHSYTIEVKAWDDPTGSKGWTKTYTGSSTPCKTKIPIPATPAVDDKCGPGNATWIKQNDTEFLDWEITPDGHQTVKALGDKVFEDGTTFHDYGVAPETNTEDCSQQAFTGTLSTNCTGQVIYFLDNRISKNSSASVKLSLGNWTKTYVLAASATTKVIRQGKPGQVAKMVGPNFSKKVTVPKPCPVRKPTASIKTSCTGLVIATLNNRASNRGVKLYTSAGKRTWGVYVGAHKVRKYDFDDRRFRPGTIIRVSYKGVVLDRARVPKACFTPPDNPPETGQRQQATGGNAKASKQRSSRLVVPKLGINARVVMTGKTKGGSQAVTHSLSDVF